MPVQTSQITSGAGDDLSLDPAAGKNLKVTTTLDTANPGETPLATTTADGTVKRLDVNNLALHGPALDDADWVMVQDASDGKKIKKRKATDVGGVKQPLLSDPLPADSVWTDQTTVLAVKEGGSGSSAALRNSVEFAVVNNTFDQSDKTINNGDRIQVQWMESKMISANHGDTISGTLYGKTGSKFTQTWNLAVTKQPTGGWDLAPLVGQPLSTQVYSNLSFPSGFNAPSPVTIDGGTLTGIQFSINGGAWGTTGNLKSGQSIQVRGTTGASDLTEYTALVSIGGVQRTWSVTTVASLPSVAQPTITSPADNVIDLGNKITVTSSAYTPLNGAGAHASSDWELKKAGVVVSSSMASTSNLESWTIPVSDLEKNTTYTVRVLHRSNDPVDSPWSVESTFTTGSFTLKWSVNSTSPTSLGQVFGVFLDGLHYAYTGAGLLQSADGETWTSQPGGNMVLSLSAAYGVATGNGYGVVGVEQSKLVVITSNTFTEVRGLPWGSTTPSSVSLTFANGAFFTASGDGNNYYKCSGDPTDVSAWTRLPERPMAAGHAGIASDGGQNIIILGTDGATNVSNDGGTTWNAGGNVGIPVSFQSGSRILYGGGVYMVAALHSGNIKVFTSTDNGSTWAQVADLTSPAGRPRLHYAFGRWVLVMPSSTLESSDDGVTWTEALFGSQSSVYTDLCYMSYGNGRWVASRNSGIEWSNG